MRWRPSGVPRCLQDNTDPMTLTKRLNGTMRQFKTMTHGVVIEKKCPICEEWYPKTSGWSPRDVFRDHRFGGKPCWTLERSKAKFRPAKNGLAP